MNNPSSPARGTWIEIADYLQGGTIDAVVPRKGDVDRNNKLTNNGQLQGIVVPRKGDVDRNMTDPIIDIMNFVVPRKGDVDRNMRAYGLCTYLTESSPARGTLVKIHALCFVVVRCAVCRMCSPWNSPHSSRILSISLLPFRRGTDSPNLLCTHSPSSSTAIMSYSSTFYQSMAVWPPCSYSSTVSPPLVSS